MPNDFSLPVGDSSNGRALCCPASLSMAAFMFTIIWMRRVLVLAVIVAGTRRRTRRESDMERAIARRRGPAIARRLCQ